MRSSFLNDTGFVSSKVFLLGNFFFTVTLFTLFRLQTVRASLFASSQVILPYRLTQLGYFEESVIGHSANVLFPTFSILIDNFVYFSFQFLSYLIVSCHILFRVPSYGTQKFHFCSLNYLYPSS